MKNPARTQNSLNDQGITVYMPTCNRGELAIRTIESICNQSFKEWELIIVDDGSVNKAELSSYIMELNDARIIYCFNTTSRGASYSRNRAIQMASYSYITGVDDDDVFIQNRLSEFWENRDYLADHSFIYANDIIVYGDDRDWKLEGQRYKKPAYSFYKFQRRNIIGNQVFTYTRRLISEKFDESFVSAQDYECFFRLAVKYGSPYQLKECTQVLYADLSRQRISSSKKRVKGYFMFYRKYKHQISKGARKYHLLLIYMLKRKRLGLKKVLCFTGISTLKLLTNHFLGRSKIFRA